MPIVSNDYKDDSRCLLVKILWELFGEHTNDYYKDKTTNLILKMLVGQLKPINIWLPDEKHVAYNNCLHAH